MRVGIGDDAAMLAPTPGMELAVSVDMLVEDRHFFAGTDPEALGHKTLAVNLSDLAAMGALPRYALLAGALPDGDDAWLAAFMRGFRALADAHDVELIGGDTTRGPRNLCVTVIGEVPAGARDHARRRAAGRRHLRVGHARRGSARGARAGRRRRRAARTPRGRRARERLERPQPRVALGTRAARHRDGGARRVRRPAGDLAPRARLRRAAARCVDARADAGRCGGRGAAAAPTATWRSQCLLAGGDDYELCFTAPRGDARRASTAVARELGAAVHAHRHHRARRGRSSCSTSAGRAMPRPASQRSTTSDDTRLTSPTVHFLFRHPAHFIALGGGAGLARHAPGHARHAVAVPLAWLLRNYVGDTGFVDRGLRSARRAACGPRR